jgi:(p)ppGpp synthase/HD superfamily hydrolase
MLDSLKRIKIQPKEIWMVKLADQITNLQPAPYYWTEKNVQAYRPESIEIYEALKMKFTRRLKIPALFLPVG